MKRLYRNPPILEAVCELHFDLPQPLTEDHIKKLQPVWSDAYPNQQIAQQKGVQVQININKVDASQIDGGPRLICRSKDNLRLAQLSQQFLAVNQLKPYPGWDVTFRDDILSRSNDVRGTLGIDKIKLINLRYINRLDFPQYPLIWEEWLNLKPPVPAGVKTAGGVFQFSFQQDLGEQLKAQIVLATLPQAVTPPQHTSVILDVAVSLEGANEISDSLLGLLEKIHTPHNLIFDDYLSPKTQELLGAYDVGIK